MAVSRSSQLAADVLHAALTILAENGGEMRGRDVMERVPEKIELSDWAKQVYEKTGNVRWQSIGHFHSIGYLKAGYLLKKRGMWYITPEGEAALRASPLELRQLATEAYRKWNLERKVDANVGGPGDEELDVEGDEDGYTFDQIEQIAINSLENHIKQKNAYEFQDLVAALLRGMGYYTPFVAPKGKDGGIDVIAYQDPLGAASPRIRAQVKHRGTSAPVQDIRQLMGLLQREGDIGIFVSSGGFTSEATKEARSSAVHVELVDLTRFIGLWLEHYSKLTDEDKSLLPLQPIYFLAPSASD